MRFVNKRSPTQHLPWLLMNGFPLLTKGRNRNQGWLHKLELENNKTISNIERHQIEKQSLYISSKPVRNTPLHYPP